MASRTFVICLLLAVLSAAVASDSNPCRHLSLYDPWLGGEAHFDLSKLIDHAPWSLNLTWNGLDWQVMTFGVCKALPQPCPNTAPDSQSVCASANSAMLCQQYTDSRKRPASFCPSSAGNGSVEAHLHTDGERGLTLLFHNGDWLEEMRNAPNMQMIVYCDPTMHEVDLNDVNIEPPMWGSNLYTVSFRHEAGCPIKSKEHVPGAPHHVEPTHEKKGVSPGVVGIISIALLILGLVAGAFGGIYIAAKFNCLPDRHRQAMAYTQFELDEDI